MGAYPSNSVLPSHSFLRDRAVNLNELVVRDLQPIESFNTKCNLATDTLATFLKTNSRSPYSIAEVIKVSKSFVVRFVKTIHCSL